MTLNTKIFHWNVNGIRAIMSKEVANKQLFEEYVNSHSPSIIVLNETKICATTREDSKKVKDLFESYEYQYHTHATKKGYSGVSVYSKIEPVKEIKTSIDDNEGRIVVLEYEKYILIALYVPNAGSKLKRVNHRTDWDKKLRTLCKRLEKIKPLVIVGDLNVAHENIDVNNPEKHKQSAGFTDIERSNMSKLIDKCLLVDTWRHLHNDKVGYTYFDYRTRARARNAGWRIDYVLISSKLQKYLKKCTILDNAYGSDHLPLICELN